VKVVLLHSALGDARLWRHQVEALSERFEVVAPDLPGFGGTPEPPGPFSYVDTPVAHLPAALVGNSLGGRVALHAAALHQERVSKLVLVAPGLQPWEWSDDLRAYWAEEEAAWEAGDVEAAIRVNLDYWVAPAHHDEVRPQLRRAFELQAAHPDREPEWPDLPPLSSLAVPTLVVVGDQDKPDFRAIAAHVAEEIPGAELAVVAGAGHLVGLDQPDELTALLLEFLED
jgi:pimeloyl-ACP methyl ester carboxylesterase